MDTEEAPMKPFEEQTIVEKLRIRAEIRRKIKRRPDGTADRIADLCEEAANYIEHKDLKPPFTSLIISGGHTQLVRVKDYNLWEILGETRDDAVGEAFDKVARILGLGYPGGPLVEEAALTGDSEKVYFKRVYLEKFSHHLLHNQSSL